MKVAIQGQPGSYHDQAAHAFFGGGITIVHCSNFKKTFEALANGQADNLVVAIENSLFGSLSEVYDLLIEDNFWIVGEQYIRVEFCLIVLPVARIEDIREVHSQVFALSECDEFLETTLVHAKQIEAEDTAGSVALIKEWADPTKAAIASRQAAELHGLTILQSNIETHHENFTRFVILAPKEEQVTGANKTSLVLSTQADTKPGALLRALQIFAKREINMSMLQSRPIIGKAWHYLFYIDVEIGNQDPSFEEVMKELEHAGCHAQILGSYRSNKL